MTYTKLSLIGKLVSGSTPSRVNPLFWGGDVLWLTPSELTNHKSKFIFDTREKITVTGLKSCSTQLLPKTTLVITTRASIGLRALTGSGLSTNQGFKSLVFDGKEPVSPSYVYHYIPLLIPEMVRRASGTTFLEISVSDLSEIAIRLPPLPQQRAIAKILDTVDGMIEKTEALIQKLQNIKKGMLEDLLTQGVDDKGNLRPSYEEAPHLYKETSLGWLPKSWSVNEIRRILESFTSHDDFSRGRSDSGVPLINAKDIKQGHIHCDPQEYVAEKDFTSWMPKGPVSQRSVLFTRGVPLGHVVPIPKGKVALGSRILSLTSDKNTLTQEYLLHILSTEDTGKRLDSLVTGTTVLRIRPPVFKLMLFPLPPLKEQKVMVQSLKALRHRIEAVETNLSKLQNLKQGLMEDLLTGKVQVSKRLEALTGELEASS